MWAELTLSADGAPVPLPIVVTFITPIDAKAV
jgi:hypothetical protein